MPLTCNRGACSTGLSATWWNSSTRAYYCSTCAGQINAYNPGLCVERVRDSRQRMILEWAAATFGRIALNKQERVLRFIEEAVELAQANELPIDKLHTVVNYVYAKPKGDVAKEAGAVGTTLLALCELHGISAEDAERNEAERIIKMDPTYFRERHNKKAAGGIAAPTSPPVPWLGADLTPAEMDDIAAYVNKKEEG